jgi:hypothetical protein
VVDCSISLLYLARMYQVTYAYNTGYGSDSDDSAEESGGWPFRHDAIAAY